MGPRCSGCVIVRGADRRWNTGPARRQHDRSDPEGSRSRSGTTAKWSHLAGVPPGPGQGRPVHRLLHHRDPDPQDALRAVLHRTGSPSGVDHRSRRASWLGSWVTQQARNVTTDLDDAGIDVEVPPPRPRHEVREELRRSVHRWGGRNPQDALLDTQCECPRGAVREDGPLRVSRPSLDRQRATPGTCPPLLRPPLRRSPLPSGVGQRVPGATSAPIRSLEPEGVRSTWTRLSGPVRRATGSMD